MTITEPESLLKGFVASKNAESLFSETKELITVAEQHGVLCSAFVLGSLPGLRFGVEIYQLELSQ